MKEFIATLKDFGFTQKEIDVYLAVLELGEACIVDIVKKTKLPRSSAYDIVKSLEERHLLSYFVKRGKKIHVAEDPRKVVGLFEHRTEELKRMLPSLNALKGSKTMRPIVRLYEGEKGLQGMLSEIISDKRNFDAITSLEDAVALLQDDFLNFIEQRKKHRLRVRLLTQDSREARMLKEKDGSEFRETRFVPSQYDFQTANFIFGDKIAFLDLSAHPTGVLIEDPTLADTFRMYFEIMWNEQSKGN